MAARGAGSSIVTVKQETYTAQHSIAQHSTAPHSTAQHSTVPHSTLLCSRPSVLKPSKKHLCTCHGSLTCVDFHQLGESSRRPKHSPAQHNTQCFPRLSCHRSLAYLYMSAWFEQQQPAAHTAVNNVYRLSAFRFVTCQIHIISNVLLMHIRCTLLMLLFCHHKCKLLVEVPHPAHVTCKATQASRE